MPVIRAGIGYRSYVANIYQTGANDPVATVLHNDLGFDLTWTRLVPGFFSCGNTDAVGFVDGKTAVFVNAFNSISGTAFSALIAEYVDPNSIAFLNIVGNTTWDQAIDAVFTDEIAFDAGMFKGLCTIEIRVYD